LTQGNENQSGKNKLSGKRIDRKFITKEGIIIHADVNGSFNIVRKILLHFKYHQNKVNLKYELMELNMSKKVKLNNFYQQSLIKKQKLKKIHCEQSGLALNI